MAADAGAEAALDAGRSGLRKTSCHSSDMLLVSQRLFFRYNHADRSAQKLS